MTDDGAQVQVFVVVINGRKMNNCFRMRNRYQWKRAAELSDYANANEEIEGLDYKMPRR